LSGTSATFYSASGTIMNIYSDNATTDNILLVRGNSGSNIGLAVKGSANVGIGTSSPDASDWNSSARLLHIYQNTTNGSVLKLESSNTSGIVATFNDAMAVGTTTNDPLLFYTNVTERMRITSGGNVGIGNIGTTNVRLFVTGQDTTSSNYAFLVYNSGSSTLLYLRNDGLINTGTLSLSPYNYSATGRTMIVESSGHIGYLVSTRESKSNIESIKNIDFINQLNPVQFNYRKKDNDTNEYTDELYDNITYGFIADEVEKVNKELVFYNTDNTLAGVEYNSIIAILTKAIQELNEKLVRNNIN